MGTIAIPLKDFVSDAENPVDLGSLPADEAQELVRRSLAFLPADAKIVVSGGAVSITLPEGAAAASKAAKGDYQQAQARAQRGQYEAAIRLYEQVLRILPGHIEARRNLAMAQLEFGHKDQAKTILAEVLRLEPKDTWTYVLLGNIYSKHENDHQRAERLYRRAWELNPKDVILLTNLGALMVEKGARDQAEEFFNRALEANPDYPHAYYGLALLQTQQGQPGHALATIDTMFRRPLYADRRAVPVYGEARKLYLEASRAVAVASRDEVAGFLRDRTRAVEAETGYGIDVSEDNSLEYVAAVTQLAWNHGSDRHKVRYRDKGPLATPHLVAHELEHIVLEYQARRAGRGRSFATTKSTAEYATRSIGKHAYKLRDTGYGEESIASVMGTMIKGLANQLFNAPIDMLIEHRLYEQATALRANQFVSLHQLDAENLAVFTNPEIRKLTPPPRILRPSLAINCSFALFIDWLYHGITDYSTPYRSSDVFSTGRTLLGLCQETISHFKPGDEYALVDEFARVLGLQQWFEWRHDRDEGEPARPPGPSKEMEVAPQGPTNPELLKEKAPAAVMYFLDALGRIDGMTTDAVRRLAADIGLIGTDGIDYASSERKYSVKAFPGEWFSGLHLLCLMYAGFKQTEPGLDTGLDLADAYEQAHALFKGRERA